MVNANNIIYNDFIYNLIIILMSIVMSSDSCGNCRLLIYQCQCASGLPQYKN